MEHGPATYLFNTKWFVSLNSSLSVLIISAVPMYQYYLLMKYAVVPYGLRWK